MAESPYEHTVPTSLLQHLIYKAAWVVNDTIKTRQKLGEFEKDSFGIVLLDPTAPLWKPSAECILATITFGENGEKYIVNGAAKVIEHRDHGVECGIMVYTANHMLADGDFCWGYSVCLNGTYAGGSGLTELQDRLLVTAFVNEFNYLIDLSRKSWREQNQGNGWYCNENLPSARYTNALAAFAQTATVEN